MKTVYQVQFKSNKGQDAGIWMAFCSKKKYDIAESLEEAKKVLSDAKAWHNHCNEIGIDITYSYRIAKIQYTVEYTEA